MAPTKDGDDMAGTESAARRKTDDKDMKRSRWATRRLTVKSSSMKRLSLIGRKNTGHSPDEKKRASGGSESLRQGDSTQDAADSNSIHGHGDGPGPRTLYFNLPLPDELQDEEGYPAQQYTRNKIRTAKYTPLSFVPKNLWFQFHNIANIFFLFLVILAVSTKPALYLWVLSFAYPPADIPYFWWCEPWT
jgi:phospholipid-translocating ATPase